MKMLEQPPPGPDDLRELPPRGWRGMSPRQFWGMCVVGGVVLLLAPMVAAPMILRSSKAAARTETINNAKQLGLALLEFERDFGTYPSDKTIAAVIKATGATLDYTDGSSNAMFRQLIAYGIQSEDIFYCLHPEGTVRPDNDIFGRDALEAREVGFSYVVGLKTSGDPDTPVLLTPMKTTSYDRCWREKEYRESAVVLWLDHSVSLAPVRPLDDKAVNSGGVPILDAAQPYFGGKWPDIRHPKMGP
ncbi:hypothetical protein [Haloferula sp. A504]|uniref:hypothetical protein n=1 Tax=Haloferula sp. A504 TaxID=3373601 RepID=UPI0031C0FE2E|nr:hypothetical protein [Verrucomicrobiaceae bacterium E54]